MEINTPVTRIAGQHIYKNWANILARQQIIWVILIAVIGASIYFQTYNFNFTLDDNLYTNDNSAVKRGLKAAPDIFTHGTLNYFTHQPSNSGNYRPVSLFSFAVEYELFGEFNPKVGHTVNIVLYFLILIFTGLVLVKLFQTKKTPLLIPLLILLLYALHPIHTEVVASIKSRDSLLAAFFSFWSLYLYISYINNPGYLPKIFTALIFFIGLLAKEDGITFIAVFLLVSYVFYKRSFSRSLKDILPILLAAAAYLIIRTIVLEKPTGQGYTSGLNNIIYPLEGPERLATNLYVYLYYIKLLIFPSPLSWDYSFNQITPKSFMNGWVLLSVLFFVFLIIAGFKGITKRTILGFGILYYLSTFSVFSNFTPGITIGATIGERFLFLPSLGFTIILVYGLYLLARKINSNKAIPLALMILIPVSLLYSLKSFSRTKVWSDNLKLYQSGLLTAPESWRVHNNMAEHYRLLAAPSTLNADSISKSESERIRNYLLLAKDEYEKSFVIIKKQKDRPTVNQMNYADVMFRLGDTLSSKKAYEEIYKSKQNIFGVCFKLGFIAFNEKDYNTAINYYQKALTASSPDLWLTYKNLGASYLMNKDYPNSIKAYEKALELGKGEDISANLAFLYSRVGNTEKADQIQADQLQTQPVMVSDEEKNFTKWIREGKVAYDKGDYREAIRYFSQCEGLFQKYGGIVKHRDLINAWARSHLNLNETGPAKIIFNKVAEADPRNFYALQNLGFIAFEKEKNYPQAIEYFNRCLQSQSPDYYLIYSNLGSLYLIQNMPDKAIESFENSLKYGSSKAIIGNLYLLWKSKGNQEKMNYYQALLNKQ